MISLSHKFSEIYKTLYKIICSQFMKLCIKISDLLILDKFFKIKKTLSY